MEDQKRNQNIKENETMTNEFDKMWMSLVKLHPEMSIGTTRGDVEDVNITDIITGRVEYEYSRAELIPTIEYLLDTIGWLCIYNLASGLYVTYHRVDSPVKWDDTPKIAFLKILVYNKFKLHWNDEEWS